MEAEKHLLKMTKKGEKPMGVWVQGSLRLLPFGIWEYVFPKESVEKVLATLIPAEKRYDVGWAQETILKKLVKTKPIPYFSRKQKYLWIRDHVNCIPLGVRYDSTVKERVGEYPGWEHEAL
tara:strand:+ start:2517 stop:2879 length:363 start_codon:yes stop_codon:yes gene_type:complete